MAQVKIAHPATALGAPSTAVNISPSAASAIAPPSAAAARAKVLDGLQREEGDGESPEERTKMGGEGASSRRVMWMVLMLELLDTDKNERG